MTEDEYCTLRERNFSFLNTFEETSRYFQKTFDAFFRKAVKELNKKGLCY
jgi:hypothetical protein